MINSIIRFIRGYKHPSSLFLLHLLFPFPIPHPPGHIKRIGCEGEEDLIYLSVSFQDTFFYSLVYDPQQKTLLADKGEIRVGSRFQADITNLLKEGESYGVLYMCWLDTRLLKYKVIPPATVGTGDDVRNLVITVNIYQM